MFSENREKLKVIIKPNSYVEVRGTVITILCRDSRRHSKWENCPTADKNVLKLLFSNLQWRRPDTSYVGADMCHASWSHWLYQC